MNIVKSNAQTATLIVLASLLLLMLFYNGLNAHPSSDDFVYAARAIHLGVFPSVSYEYRHWSGRYTSAAIMSWIARNFDLATHFWIVPSLLLGFTCVAMIYLLLAFRAWLAASDLVASAALLFIFFVLSASRLDQMFYWMAGAITYQTGICLFLLLLGLISRYFLDPWSSQRTAFALPAAAALVFLIAGTNETVMFVQSGLLLAVLLAAWWRKQKYAILWLLPLLVSLIGIAIVALAPGNAGREAAIHESHTRDFLHSLFFSLGYALFSLLASSLLLYLISANYFLRSLFTRLLQAVLTALHNVPTKHLLMALFAFFTLISMFFFPGFWAKGIGPPGRTKGLLNLMLLLGWLPLAAVASQFLGFTGFRYPFIRSTTTDKVCSLAVIVVLLAAFNLPKIVFDVATIHLYDAQQRARYTMVEKARKRGDTLVVLPKLTHLPKSVYASDISKDPNNYVNKAYAEFFGVRAVELK